MEEEGMISNLRELMAGVDRERVWIITIGLMGIILFIVFATTMLTFRVLLPEGLVGRESLRSIFQTSIWLSGICSVISIIAGVKVLFFIRTWHKSYSNLKAAEEVLEKKYFGAIRKP
ncbi:MAG: hypothetical protein WB661_09410 [Candidatus Bathyarchaeia archaeon]